jgi:hypothetical protein
VLAYDPPTALKNSAHPLPVTLDVPCDSRRNPLVVEQATFDNAVSLRS